MDELSSLIVGISLMIIMFGMGLSLTISDFKRVVEEPKAILIGLLNQLVLLPIIGFTLVTLIEVPGEIAIGIMILAACPGGATSNIIAFLAKGDTALSVSLTAVASIVTIFTIPLIIGFSIAHFQSLEAQMELDSMKMIIQLLSIVVIPVMIGMLLRAKATRFAIKMEKTVHIISTVLFILITVGLIFKERANIIPYFKQAGIPTTLLNVISLSLGYLIARSFRLRKAQSISIAVESGVQNSGLAITIAIVTLQNTTYGIAAAIYTLIMYASAFFIIMYGRAQKRMA
ncbi:bile acid:sodium symporter family protein [Spongiivirga citrea]|uniref:Bile acid:sodium symporter family protein n=1 Tax=Spongiivirga citrea TaxID=1481457 RepID=A0A6M0CGV9_9FLAO|nr:bile acid:sodium symporter family protein [Spongiivirga citrea]NER17055.1 bile acid:sodium symporter family protein [Spongiivirga citrea]